ncbi:ankyrin repeat domain-containing protein 26-like isoform X4 [Mastomys coucha]|uniref:ankyrin repeat domain-containing protein 26-like isoform X4 n=1 Tax=Mastomys coucha TaxID=35658 RepID=UPI0012625BE8|nr:ankyrin repeat domain-containing protein 26-like isoform X4 [Mastomys coucha]
MKKIFKGHSSWGFLNFRHAENQEPPRYLTGYTPVKKIHKAASIGDIPQVQKMLEFADIDVNVTDRKKRTALHYACAHGQSEMVSLLLWYDCNIEARDQDESTALIKATQRQHENCVKILLENGANANAIDAYQNTALHYTVYNNDTAIAAKLLAFNADTEMKKKNGYTPLILAVLENKQEMVELLLQAAADINALDNCKRSALIHAVRTQSKNMVSLLLQQGADASLVDIYGATAQSYAVFETFQVLSQGQGPRCPELTTKEDRHSFDTKDGLIPCSHPTTDDNQRTEENIDAVDKLGSQTSSKHKEKELQICEDCNSEADTCSKCYSRTRPSNSEPIEVEDEPSLSTKPPVVQSSMLTDSNLWVGYPADWPEPIKFSRQSAVYNPTEWREDMESRSIPIEESQQQVPGLPGEEANTQTHELWTRVFREPGANDPDLPARENAEDELVSLLDPLEENKQQMKEFPVTEAVKFQTDVKLERQGVLEFEEKGLEICQDSNLEAVESTESFSIPRVSTKPAVNDSEPTTRKEEYKFDTKDKDRLERHPLAARASRHQAKQLSPPPSQLQERAQEPEMDAVSDEEDTSGLSKSAKGQMLGGKLMEGEKPEGKETVQCVINKPTKKGGEIYEGVNAKEERPPVVSGKAHLTSAPTNLAYSMLDCGNRDVSAALVSVALPTLPRQEEGALGNTFPPPSSSQVIEYRGQSLTKFPLTRNKLDCENNASNLEESFHKRKEKSSKNIESRKVKGKCPEVRMGEKQEDHEFKSQLQKTMKPKCTDWQLDTGHMLKSSDANRLSNAKERSHVSEVRSWSDSTLVSDMTRKSKGTQDLSLKPLPCKGDCEAPARTMGTARDAPPGGRTTRAFEDEELQNRLSDSEFRILEEEILAWEKVHLEKESISENLLNKCEGIISDATAQQGQNLEMEQAAEVDSEGTSQLEPKSLDSSETPQPSDPDLSKTCPQTQNTPADPTAPIHPLSEKESKQIHPPPLHLKKMSEDLEINKTYDKECAPGHPKAPSVEAHGRESLTRDTSGNDREANLRTQSKQKQHPAGDVLGSICPVEEPLPANCRTAHFQVEEPLPANCRTAHFQVEEISKKQWSSESEVEESLRLMVTECNDNQLIFRRIRGMTGTLSPAEEKDELAKSVPDSCIKEEKDSESEAWAPQEPVVTPVFEKSPPEAAGQLLLKDRHLLAKMDPVERRLTKREAKEKHKTETQVKKMEEASCGNEPCATASDQVFCPPQASAHQIHLPHQRIQTVPHEFPSSCFMAWTLSSQGDMVLGNPFICFLFIIGSSSQLKSWDTAHSDKRLIELKKSHCELLKRKPGEMKNKASEVQREQTEIKNTKPRSQHKEVAWDELCALSFPLKQNEKQENGEFLFQQKKPQLRREKEQCGGSVEWTRHPEIRTVVAELKALEKDLRQLQEAQDELAQTAQSSEKIRGILQRLEVRFSKLKLTLKEQSAKIEQVQNHLLHEGLLGDETKKLILQTQSLECTLEKQTNKNEELLTELTSSTI